MREAQRAQVAVSEQSNLSFPVQLIENQTLTDRQNRQLIEKGTDN